MKVVPVTVGSDRLSMIPSLDSHASTIISESSDSITDGPNSTVQIRVAEEPYTIELIGSLVMDKETSVGTKLKEKQY